MLIRDMNEARKTKRTVAMLQKEMGGSDSPLGKLLMGPDKKDAKESTRLQKLLEKLGREPIDMDSLNLTKHEKKVIAEIIDPDDMEDSFADIGGLGALKKEIWALTVLPVLKPALFDYSSKLVKRPLGVLLYGPPGCGKTLLAKAIAKESRAIFLSVKMSSILSQFWGQAEQKIEAIFNLAHKLSPAIIFMDEMDCLFASRDFVQQRGTSLDTLKADFLTRWDGISTNQESSVIIIGATNRPQDIDAAILRRMPRTFALTLPDARGREQILRTLLKGEDMNASVEKFLPRLASELTDGYSGSDLKGLCCAAAMEAIHELASEEAKRAVHGEKNSIVVELAEDAPSRKPRPINEKDFREALGKVKKTGEAAQEFAGKKSSVTSKYMYV